MARIKYGLLGMSLPYTLSPAIHALLGNNSYKVIELGKNDAAAFISSRGFQGINVTYPYKRLAASLCDSLSETASRTGVVNTIINDDGVLEGYNTDVNGFYDAIKHCGAFYGKKMILGSGATCASVQAAFSKNPAEECRVVSRTGSTDYSSCRRYSDTEMIINTTPVGTSPDIFLKPDISLSDYPDLKFVFDVIYNPLRSSLLLEATSLGIPCCNGLYMLVSQACASDRLFFNRDKPADCDEIYDKILSRYENIYISGMPGCGKSYFGKLLSKRLGMAFTDVDAEITSAYRATPESIIKSRGEEYFREIESSVIRGICGKRGYVVSLGGGSVLRGENVELMRRTGHIILLGRNLSKLSVKGRPLSEENGVERLYERRRFSYEGSSDFYVFNDENEENTLNALCDAVYGMRGTKG